MDKWLILGWGAYKMNLEHPVVTKKLKTKQNKHWGMSKGHRIQLEKTNKQKFSIATAETI